MIMMGLKNTSEIPFDTVYLHGLIRDPEGVKMSKSRGNVMDPLELIDLYGADALRFALTSGNSPGNDMRLNEQKMEASRNFANKLWNASRFVIGNIDRADGASDWQWPPASEHVEDRWVLSRLNRVAGQVQTHMEEYQFGEAQRVVHDFLWGEYCDWYLETAKIRIREGDETPLPVLAYVLERLLRLLHPFMPFITEEVWQNLVQRLPDEAGRPDSLIVASYPVRDDSLLDEDAESAMAAVIEIVRAVRNLRAEFRIRPNESVTAVVDAPDVSDVIESEATAIRALAQIDPLVLGSDNGAQTDAGQRVSLVLGSGTVTVPLEGLVDVEQERARLTRRARADRLEPRPLGLTSAGREVPVTSPRGSRGAGTRPPGGHGRPPRPRPRDAGAPGLARDRPRVTRGIGSHRRLWVTSCARMKRIRSM